MFFKCFTYGMGYLGECWQIYALIENECDVSLEHDTYTSREWSILFQVVVPDLCYISGDVGNIGQWN